MQLGIEAPMAELGVARPSFGRNPIPAKGSVTVRQLLPHFRSYLLYELNLAPKTVKGYEECLVRALSVWREIRPDEITTPQILALKADLAAKGVGQTWTRNVLQAVRSFLRFCQLGLGLEVFDPQAIRVPKISRREVFT